SRCLRLRARLDVYGQSNLAAIWQKDNAAVVRPGGQTFHGSCGSGLVRDYGGRRQQSFDASREGGCGFQDLDETRRGRLRKKLPAKCPGQQLNGSVRRTSVTRVREKTGGRPIPLFKRRLRDQLIDECVRPLIRRRLRIHSVA